MKMRMLGKALVTGIIAVLACGCGGEDQPGESERAETFQGLAQASLVAIAGSVEVPGLAAGVEVLRDEWGVPRARFYRLVTAFSDRDKSLVTIAPGVSGQPGSPYYGNLLERGGG
jgi:acyl-homoserine lactone acylase PvdQ